MGLFEGVEGRECVDGLMEGMEGGRMVGRKRRICIDSCRGRGYISDLRFGIVSYETEEKSNSYIDTSHDIQFISDSAHA